MGLIFIFTSCRKENDLLVEPIIKNQKYAAKIILKEINNIQPVPGLGSDPSTTDYNTYSFTLNYSDFIYNSASNEYYFNLTLQEGSVNGDCQLDVFLRQSSNSLKKLPYLDADHKLNYSYSLQDGSIHLTISVIENQYQKIKQFSVLPTLINYEIHVTFDSDDWK